MSEPTTTASGDTDPPGPLLSGEKFRELELAFAQHTMPPPDFQARRAEALRKEMEQQSAYVDQLQDVIRNKQQDIIFDPAWLDANREFISYKDNPLSRFYQHKEETMLEQLLRLYTTAIATGVTSPMPHFVGPPGSGKSTVFYRLADMLGVELHVVNVSRLSPLGLEGLEMPDAKHEKLELLMSKLWTKANDGDIYLFDEFLRGFPEVYNGLLDIFTSREVAGFKLPRVFIAGASNSTVAYDKALEDRLLHLTVPDPRKKPSEKLRLAQMIVDQLGLHPDLVTAYEMENLLTNEVLPTFEIIDQFNGKASRNGNASVKGSSVRKLIGQAQLRQVEASLLKDVIAHNNNLASRPGKAQYMFLLTGKNVPAGYEKTARSIKDNPKLTPVQALNLQLNLELIEMEKSKEITQEGELDEDDLFADDDTY